MGVGIMRQVRQQPKTTVDRTTARRLEMAEEFACVYVTRAHRHLRAGSRAEVLAIAGGSACFIERGSPISQCIGCGVSSPVSNAEIEAIEEFYWSRGTQSQMVVSCAFAGELEEALRERGYQQIEENLGFVRPLPLGTQCAAPAGYILRELHEDERTTWAKIQAEIFFADPEEGAAFKPTAEVIAQAEGYRCYVAVAEATAEIAAGGGICIVRDGKVACLAGAATYPSHRNHGLQNALLQYRLADASAAGCTLAFVSTLPGTVSHRNVERQGFVEAYERVVMAKRPSDVHRR